MHAPETIRILAERMRALEASCRPCAPVTIPLGLGGLGELFPDGGLAAGSLVELLPRSPGAGAWTLALVLARYACGERKTLLIADAERCFYPPAARAFGLDPERTIIVRPRQASDALLALAQALRCSAIGAGIGAFDRLHDRDARKLQLAAEASGAIGVLVRPMTALHAPSFAAVRWLLEPLPSARGRRRLRVEVLRCRTSQGSAALTPGLAHHSSPTTHHSPLLEIDDATGHVRAFSPLELAADRATTAGVAG